MTAVQMMIWLFVGSLTALLFLLTQQWSVNQIHPEKSRGSIGLIVGGTFLRWVFIFSVLFVAQSYSSAAMVIVFITFLLVRLLFLLKWGGWLQILKSIFHHSEG
ncbi:MAG: hypothetical protein K0B06_06965 [Brevefilum sp.]|nr:hypothetical protein [Brevefilum sp.]